MIKDSDLRLGNLLEYGDGFISVDINVLRDLNIYLQTGLKPIAITEEWLLKAGFNYKNYHPTTIGSTNVFGSGLYISQMISNGFSLVFQTDKKSFYFEFSDRYINYVHEFQNLYFSLTGSDLVFSTEP